MAMVRQSRPSVLLIRPTDASARFAAQIAARFGDDLPVLLSPVLQPAFVTPAWDDAAIDGVIFSSETGVRGFCLASPLRGLPAWCVGPRTAEAAQAAGFAAQDCGGTAQTLLAHLRANPPAGRLIHARGRDTTGNLARDLRAAGVQADDAVVYAQNALPLTPEARALLHGASPVIVPLFSPRTGQIFATQLTPGLTAPLWLVGLSAAVTRLASGIAAQRRGTAQAPTALAMLQAMERMLNNADQTCALGDRH